MRTTALRRRAVAIALVAVLSAPGCGGSSDTRDAREATGSAEAAANTTTEPTATTLAPGAFADAVRARDLAAIQATFADDIKLYSPVFTEPFTGRDRVGRLFGILLDTLQDVEITDEITDDDRFVLVFDARIGDEPIQIADLLSFDTTGRIETFVVTARPAAGIEALAAAVAPQLPEIGGPPAPPSPN